jgi:hypothetical protein
MKEEKKRAFFMKEKEKEKTECPVCKETFNSNDVKPHVLPTCGHTLCAACLQQIVRFPVSRRLCPLDKRPTSTDFSSSPVNYVLLEVLSNSFQLPLILKFQRSFSNSDVYNGEWQDGKIRGYGKCIYASGDVYEGDWIDGKIHGRVSLVMPMVLFTKEALLKEKRMVVEKPPHVKVSVMKAIGQIIKKQYRKIDLR